MYSRGIFRVSSYLAYIYKPCSNANKIICGCVCVCLIVCVFQMSNCCFLFCTSVYLSLSVNKYQNLPWCCPVTHAQHISFKVAVSNVDSDFLYVSVVYRILMYQHGLQIADILKCLVAEPMALGLWTRTFTGLLGSPIQCRRSNLLIGPSGYRWWPGLLA